ncbi:rhodanese-like domain-containing protein, partial [Candidatus Bathyarchaeota archaeon]|nr:rhodanese-like domain-containing protein [Candidatus Bathyarchaeota archaeon]
KSAKRVFVGHLPGKTNNFELEKPLACICSVGFRGSLGTSILKRQGFKNVYNVLGGMTAWSSLNYPTVKH